MLFAVRPVRTSVSLSLALVGAVSLTGCGSSSGSITARGPAVVEGGAVTTDVSLQSLRQAARRTSESMSGGFELVMDVSGDGAEMPARMRMTMSGVYSGERSKYSVATDLGDLGDLPDGLEDMASMLDMEMVTDGATAYVKGGMFAAFLGGGEDTWVRMPAEEAASQAMGSPLGDEGITQLLAGAYGDVVELGGEEVRGVATTHYRVQLDPAKVAGNALLGQASAGMAGIDEVPVDVWIDGDGALRRMSMALYDGDAAAVTMDMEFFDLGRPVQIDVPTDAVDFDEEAFTDSMLGGLDDMFGDVTAGED